jgi:hypothetical protein
VQGKTTVEFFFTQKKSWREPPTSTPRLLWVAAVRDFFANPSGRSAGPRIQKQTNN